MFSYRKSYYLTHPFRFVRDVWVGVKNYWHRSRYGYAYVDAWNMSEAWCKIGANMMLHLAQHGNAYPGYGKFDTPEKWKAHLEDMARRLRMCADEAWDEENEYYRGYIDSGLKDKELGAKYYARARELQAVREAFVRETFEEIGRNLDLYWD